MKKLLLTLSLLVAFTAIFGQTNARERADNTSIPEIDNLSGLKPDEDELTPTSGVATLSEGSTDNDGVNGSDEGTIHQENEFDLKGQKSEGLHDVQVYPNPAQDFVYISCDVENGTAIILNLLGQEMRNFALTGSVMSVDITDLKSGIYFLSIQNGDTTIVKKFKVL